MSIHISLNPRRVISSALVGGLVLIVLCVAAFRSSSRRHTAVAASSTSAAGEAERPATRPSSASQASAEALVEWLSAPVVPVGRNLFALSDPDPSAVSETQSSEAKSRPIQVDAQEQRQGFRDEPPRQAIGQIRLQSTMMGPVPRALVNGRTVREGDVVTTVGAAGESGGTDFRVLRIEARRVIFEREGIKLEVPLE